MIRNTAISAHTGHPMSEDDKSYMAMMARTPHSPVVYNRRAAMYLSISDHGRPPQAMGPKQS